MGSRGLFDAPLVALKEQKIPYSFAKRGSILPIEEKEGTVVLATVSRSDYELHKEARLYLGTNIELYECTKDEIDAAIEQVYHQKGEEREAFFDELNEDATDDVDIESIDILDQSSDSPIIRLLNIIFLEAIEQGASDIHFEPTEVGLHVRYRIDGVLQTRHTPPKEYQSQLLTRVKVLAKLDIAEKRLPQDGRIKLAMGGRTIDFRVSTVPVVYGERIVLRILDRGNVLLGLDRIGMPKAMLTSFRKAISSNQGIILVTGPTGSGKTTTLYSALSEVNGSDVNIMTIEDPVEYKLPGIAQIGVNPKISLTFSKGLRHILRQDPDVVMIGEIRDKETAEIAIQASLTGHLVLSTLHTNDAPSAITRLVDMGIEPYLLSSSLLSVMAQRLLRRICPHCTQSYEPTNQELKDLELSRDQLKNGVLHMGKGCDQCYHTGYQGRIGIYEYMPVSRTIKEKLLQSVDAAGLQQKAEAEGMSSLKNEASIHAIQGLTTSAEVLRVTRHGNV